MYKYFQLRLLQYTFLWITLQCTFINKETTGLSLPPRFGLASARCRYLKR
jgi:hypothetical protein